MGRLCNKPGQQCGCEWCLGELKEGVEEVRGEVVSAGAAQQVGDHQEAPASDHLLLDAGGPLHKLADELHEGGAEDGVGRCLLLRPAHWVVQLGEQWEQHLDTADGVEGGVDRARHDCRHVLSEGGGQWQIRILLRTAIILGPSYGLWCHPQ